MRGVGIAVALVALMAFGAGSAAARAVPPATARHAIQADRFDWPYASDRPSVLWCSPKHFGTICRVTESVCFNDQVYGLSVLVSNSDVWVSRTRREISVAPLLHTDSFAVWASPNLLCRAGDVPHADVLVTPRHG